MYTLIIFIRILSHSTFHIFCHWSWEHFLETSCYWLNSFAFCCMNWIPFKAHFLIQTLLSPPLMCLKCNAGCWFYLRWLLSGERRSYLRLTRLSCQTWRVYRFRCLQQFGRWIGKWRLLRRRSYWFLHSFCNFYSFFRNLLIRILTDRFCVRFRLWFRFAFHKLD